MWQVFVSEPPLPSPPRFLFGVTSNFVGSECGQIQSVKLPQNMVSNRTPHPPPLSQSHTACIYCTLTQGRGEVNQREDYRDNSSQSWVEITTWLTLSPVYKLYKHLPQSPFTSQFFRGRHFVLVSLSLISPWYVGIVSAWKVQLRFKIAGLFELRNYIGSGATFTVSTVYNYWFIE